MARHKDCDWGLPDPVLTWEQVSVAVLMDIRDGIRRLNAAIYCPNALEIPDLLRTIARNTKRRPAKAKVKR